MFETITSQLELAFDGLSELVENTGLAHHSPSPFLLVQPPHARENHVILTRTRSDELASLLDTIQVLEAKVGTLRQRVFRQQRRQVFALTAISALPSEMLRAIFTLATLDPQRPDRQVMSASSSLSQVCWEWHEVAMSQRALWKNIRLSLPKFNHSTELLKLSKGDFVKMKLYETPRYTIKTEILRESQHRFRDLSISCLHACDAGTVFNRLIPTGQGSFEFSNVESLFLQDEDSVIWQYNRRSLTFPKLQHLVLSGVMLSQGIHANQLVSLDISRPPRYSNFVDEIHNLLDGSLRLQTLAVKDAEDHAPLQRTQKPVVTLQHLSSIQVKNLNFLGLADILSRFIAPHLESFVAEGIMGTPNYGFSGIEDDDVETEHVGLAIATWEEFFRFQIRKTLAQSDRLAKVDIIGHPWDTPELLRALRPTRRVDGTYGSVPASQLKTLSIELPQDMACTAEAADDLVDMLFGIVELRAEKGQVLERLIITECLAERSSFQSAYFATDTVLFALETPPCICDQHDITLE